MSTLFEETLTVRMFIPGRPVPKGSNLRPVKHSKTGAIILLPDKKAAAHERTIQTYAADAFRAPIIAKPVGFLIDSLFVFDRPASVKRHMRENMVVYPDEDKLRRTLLDGLAGVVYENDAQVIGGVSLKMYATSLRREGTYVNCVSVANDPDLIETILEKMEFLHV